MGSTQIPQYHPHLAYALPQVLFSKQKKKKTFQLFQISLRPPNITKIDNTGPNEILYLYSKESIPIAIYLIMGNS